MSQSILSWIKHNNLLSFQPELLSLFSELGLENLDDLINDLEEEDEYIEVLEDCEKYNSLKYFQKKKFEKAINNLRKSNNLESVHFVQKIHNKQKKQKTNENKIRHKRSKSKINGKFNICFIVCIFWIRFLRLNQFLSDEILEIIHKFYSFKFKIQHFNVISVIGRGSFGKVVLAKERSTSNSYAIKILKKKKIAKQHQIENTQSESLISQILNTVHKHPFLVTTKYIFHNTSRIYFVNEWYCGGDLYFHLKKKKKFSELEAQFIVAQIILAIGHLHKYNIIHRCVKPEDIYFDSNGYCILGDYGISKILENKERSTNTICGTPEYMAPEIVDRYNFSDSDYSFPVDWWSIGILLYELVVGIPPFYSTNVNEMYVLIKECPLVFPTNEIPLSKSFQSIVKKLLHRNPLKRLGTPQNENETGVENVKRQSFFKHFRWDYLLQRKLRPLYQPQLKFDKKKNRFTLDNVDETFTNQTVYDSPIEEGNEIDQSLFEGFEWVNPNYQNM